MKQWWGGRGGEGEGSQKKKIHAIKVKGQEKIRAKEKAKTKKEVMYLQKRNPVQAMGKEKLMKTENSSHPS